MLKLNLKNPFIPKGVPVPVEIKTYESIHGDDFHPLDTHKEFPVVPLRHRPGCRGIPCFDHGNGLFEPAEYSLIGSQMSDPTFLEDPYVWPIKPSYRMASPLHWSVNAFALDVDGLWRPLLLRPVLTVSYNCRDEVEGVGFRGAMQDPRGFEPTMVPGTDILQAWYGKGRSVFICNDGKLFDHRLPMRQRLRWWREGLQERLSRLRSRLKRRVRDAGRQMSGTAPTPLEEEW